MHTVLLAAYVYTYALLGIGIFQKALQALTLKTSIIVDALLVAVSCSISTLINICKQKTQFTYHVDKATIIVKSCMKCKVLKQYTV